MHLHSTTGVEYKELFTVGDAARLNNVTVRSLYHYQNKGMLIPSHTGGANRYRKYSYQQFFLLDIIKRFKRCGVPLKSLSRMIESKDIASAASLLQSELGKIEDEITRLESVKRDIAMFKHFYDEMPGILEQRSMELGRYPQSHVLAVPIDPAATFCEADFALRTVLHSPLFRKVKFFLPMSFLYDVPSFLAGEIRRTHRACRLIKALDFSHEGYHAIPEADCLTVTLGHAQDEAGLDGLRRFLSEHALIPKYIFCEEYYDSITNFEQPLRRVKVVL